MANPHSDEQKLLDTLTRLSADGWVRGVTFPELARSAEIGLRSVPRHIERLEAAQKIRCHNERGRGRINSYQILS